MSSRAFIRGILNDIEIPNKGKKYLFFNTHVIKTCSGVFMKIRIPLNKSKMPPICDILPPNEVRYQFAEYEDGTEDFNEIKEAMNIQESAIKKDEKCKEIFYKVFGDHLKGEIEDTSDFDIEEEKRSEIKEKYLKLYLWNIAVNGSGPWESHHLTTISIWNDLDEESFDEYHTKLCEDGSIDVLSKDKVDLKVFKELVRMTNFLFLMSANYIDDLLEPPSLRYLRLTNSS